MSLRVKVKERLGKRFDDEIRFFRGMMQGPKTVGSIVPTSSITAKRMASVVDIHSGLPVLELGPGTGAITKAILGRGVRPENLVAIEYSTDFHKHLQRTYPGVHFINGDAFDLQATLGNFSGLTFDSVVSGIPLLNFPMAKRISLLESLLDRLPPPADGADFLRRDLADRRQSRPLPYPAFRLRHAQHSAGAALDL